jgi:hypothetical protein
VLANNFSKSHGTRSVLAEKVDVVDQLLNTHLSLRRENFRSIERTKQQPPLSISENLEINPHFHKKKNKATFFDEAFRQR